MGMMMGAYEAEIDYNRVNQTAMDFKIITYTKSAEANWKESLDTEDLIRNYLPFATDNDVEKYIKEIGKIWEVFEIKSKDHSWTVAKSHDQIQDFIIEYNLKFKAKLVFGTFMMRGLQEVCQNHAALEWHIFQKFFEWEELEIKKVKSMRLLKKSGGRYKDYFCCRLPWQWNYRDFVITKSGVLYYSATKEPKEYLPFGNSFNVFAGKRETGYQFGIRLQANHRKLLLFAESSYDFFQFVYFIHQTQRQALLETQNRFHSFSPVRGGNSVQFIVDGEDYFRAVAEGFERAQEQIMIAGWYISPEFQLMRPVSLHKEKRLDVMLKRAAERGLKVFILVYNQSSFLTNDSAYVKQTLEGMSPSIKVLQHPLGVLPTFWSHHQKLVIIDQSQAFMGGLDLGFARYDDSQHLLNHNDPDFYPGLEYNNVRNTDLSRVREFWRDGVSRDIARLPWHDVGLHLTGDTVLDLSHHYIQYWNYASFQTYYQDRYVLVLQRDRPKKPFYKKIGEDIANKLKNIKQFAGELKKKIFKSDEQDEENAEGLASESGKGGKRLREEHIKVGFKEGSSDTNSSKDKRWGKFDQSWYETNSPAAVRLKDESNRSVESDVAIRQGEKVSRFKSMRQLDQIVETMQDEIKKIDFMNDLHMTKRRTQLQEIQEEVQEDYRCQVLRSVGSWSIGCDPSHKEQSIHTAYLHLIRTAKRFIYIENQFFISMTATSTSTVKNQIANEIYKRVLLAVLNKESFKIWVIIPLIPGFAGELDDAEAVIPRVIMHWQFSTICRGENSLMGRIAALGVNPNDYVKFFGLRTHGLVADKPTTEIVYLHSKLIIADDQRAICGSANINERSMRGSRDSEVCLLIEEGPQKEIKGRDGIYTVSEAIYSLRERLFHEHFGGDFDVSDPSSDELFQKVKARTAKNTALYRQIFRCYPDDYIKTLAQLTILRNIPPNAELYEKCKEEIVGFAVDYPLEFLKDEDLLVGATLYPDSLSV